MFLCKDGGDRRKGHPPIGKPSRLSVALFFALQTLFMQFAYKVLHIPIYRLARRGRIW